MHFHKKRGDGMSGFEDWERLQGDELYREYPDQDEPVAEEPLIRRPAQPPYESSDERMDEQAADEPSARRPARPPREQRRPSGGRKFIAGLATGILFAPPVFVVGDLFLRDGQENAWLAGTLAEFQFKQNPPHVHDASATTSVSTGEELSSTSTSASPTASPSAKPTPSDGPTTGISALPDEKSKVSNGHHQKTVHFRTKNKEPVIVVGADKAPSSNQPQTAEFRSVTVREQIDAFLVSKLIAGELTSDGYKVYMLQQSPGDAAPMDSSIAFASDKHADMIIGVDTDHTRGSEYQAVYPEVANRITGSQPNTLEDPACSSDKASEESLAYAEAIARARENMQNHTVRVVKGSSVEAGNGICVSGTSEAELIPWISNDMGVKRGHDQMKPASIHKLKRYAEAITAAVEDIAPIQD
jgi:hypothetical protein